MGRNLILRVCPVLPTHHAIGRVSRTVSAVALAAAGGLIAANVIRLTDAPPHQFGWVIVAAVVGTAAADFASGLVHWFADTWGRADLPVLGPRLLHPFRVHHVNPDDLLDRSFIDANGDVAVIAVPVLAAALIVPLDSPTGLVAAGFLLAFGGVGLFTNQIHQWAHMPRPPAVIRGLQRCRLILGRPAHARHHRSPYVSDYCITTGWCNRPLTAVGFFPRLERLVTRLTGARPRADEAGFAGG